MFFKFFLIQKHTHSQQEESVFKIRTTQKEIKKEQMFKLTLYNERIFCYYEKRTDVYYRTGDAEVVIMKKKYRKL